MNYDNPDIQKIYLVQVLFIGYKICRCLNIIRQNCKLVKNFFLCKYGNFFAITYQKLKQEIETCKLIRLKILQNRYWIKINQKLGLERLTYERVLKKVIIHKQCPTYIPILKVCIQVNFNLRNILKIID